MEHCSKEMTGETGNTRRNPVPVPQVPYRLAVQEPGHPPRQADDCLPELLVTVSQVKRRSAYTETVLAHYGEKLINAAWQYNGRASFESHKTHNTQSFRC